MPTEERGQILREYISFLLEAGVATEIACRGMNPLHHALDIEMESAINASGGIP